MNKRPRRKRSTPQTAIQLPLELGLSVPIRAVQPGELPEEITRGFVPHHGYSVPSTIIRGVIGVGPQLGIKTLLRVSEEFDCILNLQETFESRIPGPLSRKRFKHYHRLPIVDSFRGGSMSMTSLRRAIQLIERCRRENHSVYVHCLMGIGRSVTVVTAYMMMIRGCSPQEALEEIRDIRSCANPSEQQLELLRQWFVELAK